MSQFAQEAEAEELKALLVSIDQKLNDVPERNVTPCSPECRALQQRLRKP